MCIRYRAKNILSNMKFNFLANSSSKRNFFKLEKNEQERIFFKLPNLYSSMYLMYIKYVVCTYVCMWVESNNVFVKIYTIKLKKWFSRGVWWNEVGSSGCDVGSGIARMFVTRGQNQNLDLLYEIYRFLTQLFWPHSRQMLSLAFSSLLLLWM